MIRFSTILFPLLLLLVCARAEEPKPSDADVDALVQQLNSDDFTTRNKATEALAARAGQIWDRLEQLAKSRDPEISQRVKMAMAVPGQRELQAEIEITRKKRQALDEELRNTEATLNRKVRELSEKLQTSEEETRKLIEEVDKLPEQEAAEKKKQITVKKEADEAMFKQLTALREENEKLRGKYRENFNRLETRLAQLTKLAEGGEILKPGTVASWTPAAWPFERRLSSSISFEFVDTPLDQAMNFISSVTKIPIMVDEKILEKNAYPAINLRVQDMNASLAIEWISRLAELPFYVDNENSKVIISTK